VFCGEIARALRAVGLWAYKIPDPLPHEALRVRERPFDIVFLGRVSGAIECKLAPARFRAHQIEELVGVMRAGSVSGALIYAGRGLAYWFPAGELRPFMGKKLVRSGFEVRKRGGRWDVSGLCALWASSAAEGGAGRGSVLLPAVCGVAPAG